MIVSFDSTAFVWGIKKECTSGQEEMKERGIALVEQLKADKSIIILPAPVLAECLVAVPSANRQAMLATASSILRIAPFDAIAALKFAELFHAYLSDVELKKYAKEHAIPRERIKVDYMIAAISIVQKAVAIYTNNTNHFLKFVNSEIEIRDIPLPKKEPQQKLDL